MKIRKMTASFGALEGETLELGGGLNIIEAPNESGKSTWCAFLTAMFYGVDSSQREKNGVKPDKVRYAPWSGRPMEGSMELECALGGITLTRTTRAAGAPMREVKAVRTGTETPVVLPGDAGEALLGIPKAVFERSALVRQASVGIRNVPELEKRVAAIVTTGEEDAAASEVDARLRAWLRARRHNRTGRLPQLEAEIAEKERVQEALRAVLAERTAMDAPLSAAEQECVSLRAAVGESRKRARRDALQRMKAVSGSMRALEAEKQEKEENEKALAAALSESHFAGKAPETALADAERDAQRLELLDDIRARRPNPALWLALFALAALCAGVGAAMAEMLVIVGGACVFAAGVIFLVGYIHRVKVRRAAETERGELCESYGVETPAALQALGEAYAELYGCHAAACVEAETARKTLATAREKQKETDAALLQELDFTAGDSEAARLGARLAAAEERLRALREKCAAMDGRLQAMGDPVVLASELNALREEHRALSGDYDAIALAAATLHEADDELQTRFSPALGKRAGELFARLTDGRYDAVALDKELSAAVHAGGDTQTRESGFISAGALDQLYLALRLAICELALPETDPCPLVLDDALVNFDEKRLAAALKLLRELAEKRQILLFTCHGRERAHLAGDPGVTLITLEETAS